MSKIKSKETKLEIGFRKLLSSLGLRYRKNSSGYFGKPDIVFPSKKVAIFIDACFWHGCKRHLRMPSSNKKYWETKIKRNISRDKEVNKYYRKNKWKIIRLWEHSLKNNLFSARKASEIKKLVKQ